MIRRAVPALLGLLALVACGGERTTGGRYLAVDDTGLHPVPIERGWMIAVPADAAQDVLGSPFNGAWSYHLVDIDEGDVLEAGGVWEPIGRGGQFDLPVEPGEWLVCAVADGDGSRQPGTRGCSEVTIADGARLTAMQGEHGFGVEVD